MRLTLRILGWAALAMVATMVAIVATYPRWSPALLERVITKAAADMEATIRVDGISYALSGELAIQRVYVETGPLIVECDNVRIDLPLRHALRGDPRATQTHIGHCFVERAASAGGSLNASPSDRILPDTSSIYGALAATTRRSGTTRIDAVYFFGLPGDLEEPRLTDVVLTRQPDSIQLQAIASSTRWSIPTEVDLRADRSIVARLRAPIDTTYGVLDVDTVTIFPDGSVDLRELRVRSSKIPLLEEVHIERVELEGTRSCPSARMSGGTVEFGWARSPFADALTDDGAEDGSLDETLDETRADALDNATTERTPRSRRGRRPPREPGDPSPGIDAVSSLYALSERMLAYAAHAREQDVPCFSLEVDQVGVQFGERPPLILHRVRVDDGTMLRGSIGYASVLVAFETDLEELRELEFSARGLEVAPLSPWLGGDTDVAGALTIHGALRLDELDELSFEGGVALSDGRYHRSAVSPLPLEDLNTSLDVRASIQLREPREIRTGGTWVVNGVSLDFEVNVDATDGARVNPALTPYTVEAHVGLTEATPCQQVWEALPLGMLPHLGHDGVRFTGEASPRLEATYRPGEPSSFRLEAHGFPGTCRVASIARAYDPAQLNESTYVHHVREGVSNGTSIVVGPGTDSFVPLAEMPGYVGAAMYLSEEIMFPTSPGVSVGLINRAVRMNLERGRYSYGGSTVSQQLVKNLFLTREKTLARKLEELIIVWAMEERVSKDRILELYVNCIEFGPDIYGIRAAAAYYFGIEPHELTPLEAIYLAGLKPAPLDGARLLARGHTPTTGWWVRRNEDMLHRLVTYGGFIESKEIGHYAPFVVAFPMSPIYHEISFRRIERPSYALAFESELHGDPALNDDVAQDGAQDGAHDDATDTRPTTDDRVRPAWGLREPSLR